MIKFLRKEWDDTKLPEEIYPRVRNRAWIALHTAPPRKAYRYLYATAAGVLLLLLLFFFPKADQEPKLTDLELQPLPIPVKKQFGALDTIPIVPPPEKIVAKDKRSVVSKPAEAPMRQEATQGQPGRATVAPRKVVFEFRLPKSGVRMIWMIENRTDS